MPEQQKTQDEEQKNKDQTMNDQPITNKVQEDTKKETIKQIRLEEVEQQIKTKKTNKERTYSEPEVIVDEFLLTDKTIESQKLQLRKKLGMSTQKEKKEKKNVYRDLKVKLYKAGLETEPENYIKKLMILTIITLGLLVFILGIIGVINEIDWKIITISLLAIWFLGFLLLYKIILVVSNIYLSYRSFKRTKDVERVLPEYLRLVATNYRSGLPLDKALIASNRPRFGIFSKEMEQVAKTTRIKGDFAKALEIFGKKFDSKVLERAMNSISISIKSGSNISELLDEIANNITKMRNMQASMAANVKNYVIFIVIAGIVLAPLMFAMSYQMNATISGVKDKLDIQTSGTSTGMIEVQSGGGVNPSHFDAFAILMILTNCFISSMLISMIRNGNFQQGLKNILMYAIISISLYLLGKIVLASVIGVV